MRPNNISNGSNFDYYPAEYSFEKQELKSLKTTIEDLVAHDRHNVKKNGKWKNKKVTPIQNQLVYFNGRDCLLRKYCAYGMDQRAELTTKHSVEVMVDLVNSYLPNRFTALHIDQFRNNLTLTNLHLLLNTYLEAAELMPPSYKESITTTRHIEQPLPSEALPSYNQDLDPPPPYTPSEPPSYEEAMGDRSDENVDHRSRGEALPRGLERRSEQFEALRQAYEAGNNSNDRDNN